MDDLRAAYLDLMKKMLTDYIRGETFEPFVPPSRPFFKRIVWNALVPFLARRNLHLVRPFPFDPEMRKEGRDWPLLADTMIGLKRLDNLQFCVEDILCNNVPGDLIETGVWRGGATVFMRAILQAHGVTDRAVWVADSFEGLPPPNAEKYPADAGDSLYTMRYFAVPFEEVQANFAKYGLLDCQVRFLKGWFKDTLPRCPIERLAVMRLDGDLYESTMDALINLYPKLSVGGYVIIDDYLDHPGCGRAVQDFRVANNITDEIREVDWTCVFWKRS